VRSGVRWALHLCFHLQPELGYCQFTTRPANCCYTAPPGPPPTDGDSSVDAPAASSSVFPPDLATWLSEERGHGAEAHSLTPADVVGEIIGAGIATVGVQDSKVRACVHDLMSG
jgi:hypothetical protein